MKLLRFFYSQNNSPLHFSLSLNVTCAFDDNVDDENINQKEGDRENIVV